ncbi:PfkB family carbohydrate kinase [Schaalia sp. ZJ1691]|uniref:PfkB family carbohydrate kinase n=1 Tax=Schaalia sp. ZJ1691 TaxID=2709404 RepID=UPI0013EC31EC|nr:PfkB family carbohydrate kinase [Schaalia sp. ZJ1691]
MHGVFAGLTTLDIIHALDHEPDTATKTTSTNHAMAAGGPATNAAVTAAALDRVAGALKPGHEDEALAITLLTALGGGTVAQFLAADLKESGVLSLDATAASSTEDTPAISSIIEHPRGRMVASTNARLDVDADTGRALLRAQIERVGPPDVVLVDGHNPGLANEALKWGVELAHEDGSHRGENLDDPFAFIEAKPPHLRILDGGSWKDWLTPLLPLIDIAVVSADFCPPVLTQPDGEQVAAFLRGFGITRVIRTQGPDPVQWWWAGTSGEVEVPSANAISTLGAGDIFHGALAWALGHLHHSSRIIAEDEAGSTHPHARDVHVHAHGMDNPSAVITFASDVAALSTQSFGTRSWREAPELERIVARFLQAN